VSIRPIRVIGVLLFGHNELTPLALTDEEAAQLEAFLHTLTEEE